MSKLISYWTKIPVLEIVTILVNHCNTCWRACRLWIGRSFIKTTRAGTYPVIWNSRRIDEELSMLVRGEALLDPSCIAPLENNALLWLLLYNKTHVNGMYMPRDINFSTIYCLYSTKFLKVSSVIYNKFKNRRFTTLTGAIVDVLSSNSIYNTSSVLQCHNIWTS
jgi:hypothetical protein